MAPRGFDDEELTISLSSSHIRRQAQQQQQQEEARRGRDDGSRQPPMPTIADGVVMDAPPTTERVKAKTEQRIDAYKVIRTLGEGSFGKVKLAVHTSTGQQVAL